VSGGATDQWLVEVLVDCQGQMFLHNGWRRFTRTHAIDAGHFVAFKYGGHNILTVKVVDETMCHRLYHTNEDS
jgi:hypothetical protein